MGARRRRGVDRAAGGRTSEAGRDYAWLLAEAAAAAAALFIAWRGQERLRLLPLLGIAVAFQLAIVGVHMAQDVPVDFDISIYAAQGQSLLDGDYPRSEYPTGAVSLFALETWLGDDSARAANARLMIVFQLAAVAAIWSLPDPLERLAGGARRPLAAERVLLGVQVRPRRRRRCWPSASRSRTGSGSASRASRSASAPR